MRHFLNLILGLAVLIPTCATASFISKDENALPDLSPSYSYSGSSGAPGEFSQFENHLGISESDPSSAISFYSEEKYKFIFEKEDGPFPDPDNPYQEQFTELSDTFLKDYCFPSSNILTLGDYDIDTDCVLGEGTSGIVYLARHKDSSIFFAAKEKKLRGKPIENQEYHNLKILGQLYSYWIKTTKNQYNKAMHTAYFIIPFVDGKKVIDYSKPRKRPWVTTLDGEGKLTFSDLTTGLKLIRSLHDQLNYIANKGVLQDPYPENILVTSDHKNVVLIDFSFYADPDFEMTESPPGLEGRSLSKLRYNVNRHAYYCSFFLGTNTYHLDDINEPKKFANFLKIVSPPSWDTIRFLSLYRFNAAVQELGVV